MSKVVEIVTSIQNEPFIAVEFIWAVGLTAMGVYFLLPGYEAVPISVLHQFTQYPLIADLIGVLYLFTGIVAFVGCLRQTRKFRRISTALLFGTFLFTALLRLVTFGLTPAIWVWLLLLAATAAIDNWNLNWKRSST